MGAIADKLGRLSETKELLKQRLTEKGVDVSNENVFYNLADKVGNISSSNIAKLTLYNAGAPDSFSEPSKRFEVVVIDKDGNIILQSNNDNIINIKDTTTIEVKVPCVMYMRPSGIITWHPDYNDNIQQIMEVKYAFIIKGDVVIEIQLF